MELSGLVVPASGTYKKLLFGLTAKFVGPPFTSVVKGDPVTGVKVPLVGAIENPEMLPNTD
jgi:hypothetical protein